MEEEVVNYRSFEELPHQYEQIDGDGWREKFKWIDNKRIMNKYEPQNLQLEWNILKEQCNNLRSNVQKNALLLVREIIQYDHLQYDNLESFSVLQLVFEKCNLEFKFLSSEALKTVEILSQKAYNRELIQILCQITNKCPVIQCYSYTTLVKIVCNSNLDCDWEPIIQSTLLVYDGKSVECRKASEDLYKRIQHIPEAQRLYAIAERIKPKAQQLSENQKIINIMNRIKDNFKCDCDACVYQVKKESLYHPKPIPVLKQINLCQDKDFSVVLRGLQPPNKLTRSIRIQIPETCMFIDGEPSLIAYFDKTDKRGSIKYTQKLTFQQIRLFLQQNRLYDDPKSKETIMVRFTDNNVIVMSDGDLLQLMMKRKIDPIWQKILYIQNFYNFRNPNLFFHDFKLVYAEKDENFIKAKKEIMILNGEIARASSEYVTVEQEEIFEDSLSYEEYCKYCTYKVVHYVETFGAIKIKSGRFCYQNKILVTAEFVDHTEIIKRPYFDSEILLKKRNIETDDEFWQHKILETHIQEEREYASKVYRNVLSMEGAFNDPPYLVKNKLAVIGHDFKKRSQQLRNNFVVVQSSKDPVGTLRNLLFDMKIKEEKLNNYLGASKKRRIHNKKQITHMCGLHPTNINQRIL